MTEPSRRAAPRHREPRRGWRGLSGRVWLAAVTGLVAIASGVALLIAFTAPTSLQPLPVHPFAVSDAHARELATRTEPMPATLMPESMAIVGSGIRGPIKAVSLDADGVLEPPPGTVNVGLWDGGAGLDASAGTTLLVGHVTFGAAGNGVFFGLPRVKPGSVIETSDSRGHANTWVVTSLREYRKAALPRDVFAGSQGSRRLVLVTCGGAFIHLATGARYYEDNVVVTAIPLSSTSAAGQFGRNL